MADSKASKAKIKKTAAPERAVSKKTKSVSKPSLRAPRKKVLTVRERAAKNTGNQPRRIRRTATKISTPIKKVNPFKGRKYKGVYIRGRRIRFIPVFLVNAWKEIRQVNWPNWSTTWRLTIAVFIFAVIFAVIIGLLDYVIGKIFKEVIIK